MFISENS